MDDILLSRKKTEHNPSSVLYVRNVPDECTEEDLMAYCIPFGTVKQVLLLRDKRHGFVEFGDEASAINCNSYYDGQGLTVHGSQIDFAFSGRQSITNKKIPDNNPPNRILLLTITNLFYPITVDVLVQVFGPYGGMDKVVIFNRGNAVQALVQLKDVTTACIVKAKLDGQNVYAGCNTLKVQFSSLTELEVKQNNDRSFDFTGRQIQSALAQCSAAITTDNNQMELSHQRSAAAAVAAASMMLNGSNVVSNVGGNGGGMNVREGGNQTPGVPPSSNDGSRSPVVIVHNLAEGITTCDDLAALFSVYGNVVRVKIMYKARHSALIQLGDVNQCRLAQQNLSGLALHGKEIQVEMSRGTSIPPPKNDGKEGREEPILTKDYADKPLLYSRHKVDRVQKCFPPGTTLHLSNMPDNTSELAILELLRSVGCEPVNFRFLDNELHHIAIVTCADIDNAVETLIRAHTCNLGNRQLRVGFGHAPRSQQ